MNETDNKNNNLSFHLFDMKFIFEYRVPNTKSADAVQLFRIKCELNAFCLKMFNEFFSFYSMCVSFLVFCLFGTVATVIFTVQCVSGGTLLNDLYPIRTTMASNIFALTHCLFLSKGFIKGIWPPGDLQ